MPSKNEIPLLDRVVTLRDASIEVIEIPFNSPVHLPFGTINSRPSAWLSTSVEIDGLSALHTGYAEGTSLPMPIPMYDDCSSNLEDNISRIVTAVSNKPMKLHEISKHILNVPLGGRFSTARMTVETSVIDAMARAGNKSVVQELLQSDPQVEMNIPYGKSIAETEYDTLIKQCAVAVERGSQRLKLKISPVTFDVVYRALLELIADYPNLDIMVDANGMFDPTSMDDLEKLRKIDLLGLLTIEEPVSRVGRLSGLIAHQALRKQVNFKTPITIDDAIKTSEDARNAFGQNLADIVNLKPGRIGSFIECLEVANLAKNLNKEVMVGGMFEATPGRMMTLTLAAYCIDLGFKIPGDVSLPQERLVSDLVEPSLTLGENQDIKFAPEYGWGYKV